MHNGHGVIHLQNNTSHNLYEQQQQRFDEATWSPTATNSEELKWFQRQLDYAAIFCPDSIQKREMKNNPES